jgi:LAS superfamily LD-carboxypeptidase LdcB
MFWALPIEYLIDPQQQNSYSYARNNPITFSDPTGNSTLIQSFVSAVQSFLNGIASFFGVSNSNFGSQSQTQAQAPKPSVNQANITKPTPTPAPRTTTWDPVTDQRIKQLDPRVQQPATNFVNNTESQAGVQLRVTTGYRSVEEQNRLYNQGRTTPGNVVTNARGGQSYHNYGRAIDVVIMEDGQPNWQKRIDDNVANIGIQQGFNWGGNWSGGFQDYPHFEMPLGQTIRDLMR